MNVIVVIADIVVVGGVIGVGVVVLIRGGILKGRLRREREAAALAASYFIEPCTRCRSLVQAGSNALPAQEQHR